MVCSITKENTRAGKETQFIRNKNIILRDIMETANNALFVEICRYVCIFMNHIILINLWESPNIEAIDNNLKILIKRKK
jgi:hypothetical protein